jgi:phosphoribosylformimino-5-aminoimidazole carboxamide ribotide isomerase
MIEIIPAIDLIDSQCVRLSQGDFNKSKTYSADPTEMAMRFEDAGFKRLHLVDLDGARSGAVKQLSILEKIASKTNLIIDYSGGIRSVEDIRNVFAAGASIVGIGSFAVQQPDVFMNWLSLFGTDKILLGTDVRNEQLALKGWTEQTAISVFDFITPLYKLGLRHLFCTDISSDGMLQGTAITLYKKLLHTFPLLQLIASGGASSAADIDGLDDARCSGVIIGKAIYEGLLPFNDLKKYLQ